MTNTTGKNLPPFGRRENREVRSDVVTGTGERGAWKTQRGGGLVEQKRKSQGPVERRDVGGGGGLPGYIGGINGRQNLPEEHSSGP